ncbi:MAG: squalene/phytoene synthase family protein [Alphaproteobacteria bacterium]|nr:squalene/phytoene synthase family protein [Alphaproteobacteria bacterium]
MNPGHNCFQMSDSFQALEEQVANSDPDRYVASLFASPDRRRGLTALYAFHHDVARIREVVHEPLVGHIRLGWWREQIGAIFDKRPVATPIAAALADTVTSFALPRSLFDRYLDARSLDFEEAPFGDEAVLEGYAAATAGSLMQLAAHICGAGDRADVAAREAAIAAAYAGYIRALGRDAALRHCRLPRAWLEAEGLSVEDVFAGRSTPALERIVARLAERARSHLRAARAARFPTSAITALAPVALVPRYLKLARRSRAFQPIEVSQGERVARIALAVLLWRI